MPICCPDRVAYCYECTAGGRLQQSGSTQGETARGRGSVATWGRVLKSETCRIFGDTANCFLALLLAKFAASPNREWLQEASKFV